MALALGQIRQFLASEGAPLLADGAREPYLRRTEALLAKAREPGEALYVGILGGTGVGKSMLIDALAGETISGFSDTRPFTDRAVVYRHRDRDRGLEKVSQHIREQDAVHDVDVVRNLILLDMPDFDSVERDNRRAVLEILPELDSIVWVVSPEKYADAVFYDLVRSSHKHQDSFTFVLNKADQLIDKGHSDEHFKLKEVLGDLTFRLKHEAGVEQPRLFSLSAELEFKHVNDQPAIDKEFQRFRDLLMARRDAKEIASIKTINLVTETHQLVDEIDAVIKPHDKAQILDLLQGAQNEPPEEEGGWGLEVLEHEKDLAAAIMRYLVRSEASITMVRWFLRLVMPRRWAGLSASEITVEDAFARAAAVVAAGRRAYVEKAVAQTQSELLLAFRHGSSSDTAWQEHMMDRAVKDTSTGLLQMALSRNNALNGPAARWRRGVQTLVLLFPVPILVVKLSGLPRIDAWIDNPTMTGALKILVGVLSSLFGSEGLVGLVVLGISQIFLAYWLAARRVRKIEKESGKLSRWAIDHLRRTLDSVARQAREERRACLSHIKQGIDRWNTLTLSLDERAGAMSHKSVT